MLKRIILLLVLIVLLISIHLVNAKVAGEGLTISPPIFELTLAPGQSAEKIIKLNNPTNSLVEVYPTVMNFQASANESGDPTFTPASEETSRYSLANWMSFTQKKLALTPEQDLEFVFKIDVPTNAEPGGHYGVVFFVTEPPKPEEDVSQVTLASMIGSLILVRVPGEITEKAALKEFSSKKFYFKMPVNFVVRIENLGNVHFKPKGMIQIENVFKSKTATLDLNQKGGNVLPESTRRFEEKWSGSRWTFGRFTANLAVAYGESNQNLFEKLTFYVLPWWFIILVGLILIGIIVFTILYLKKRKRKANQRKKVILR